MKGPKALVQITGAVIATALLLLVSAPRVAKSQVDAGGGPTLVLNPPGAPVYTQPVTQLPLEVIGLVCRADGETKTLSCEPLPNTGAGSFTPYVVPSTGYLMVTEVEIHDGNDITASLTCSAGASESYGAWQANGAWTNQYLIPEGIPLPIGCAPTLELSKSLAGVEVFLRGHSTIGPVY